MQAVVAGIRGQSPAGADLEWDRLTRLAVAHGVAPLLHCAWRDTINEVPAPVLGELRQRRQLSALHAAIGFRERDESLEVLRRAGIPCLVLKGSALARTWYHDPSLRPFLDVDLLVAPGEMAHAREVLRQRGFQELQGAQAPHHALPLQHPGLPCAVELHHDLTRLLVPNRPSFDDLYARSISLSGEDAHVRTLGAEDTLLHLCLHLLSHVDYDHGWQLRHLCDIARHCEAFAIDWQDFRERARALHAERACDAVLGLANVVAGGPASATAMQRADTRELLGYAIPGSTEHRLLAEFLTTLAQFDLSRAVGMLRRTIADRGEKRTGMASHAHGPSAIVRRLARESLEEPTRLRAQLMMWLPEGARSRQRERLLVDLFSASEEPEATSQETSASRSSPAAQRIAGAASRYRTVIILASALICALRLLRSHGRRHSR